MLELIKATNYDFMGKRFIAYALTGAVAIIGIVAIIAHHGPRLSIDFTGGTLLELRFSPPVAADQLRGALDRLGYADSEIQEVGQGSGDVMIRARASEGGKALDRKSTRL